MALTDRYYHGIWFKELMVKEGRNIENEIKQTI